LFETLPDDVKAKWDRAREATQNGIDSIRNLDYSNTAAGALFRSLPEEIQTAIAGLADILISPFSKWFNTVMEFIRLVARALASIRPAAPNSSVSGTPTGSGEPFARGGQVFGPGTGTSDSILARLSRGEFVIRAAAVDHFGANFFAALNAMRMPKFSAGGIADSLAASLAIPRFASGGMVSGGGLAPVTINFPGAGSFNVHASGDTVSNLRRAATRARVSSGGRKPSGYA
jgi:hypothetical protein